MPRTNSITKSSTAEYFAKNLQQVGFSSPVKAVLTTVKEAVDNALDACETAGILPDVTVTIRKKGSGSQRNTDLIEIIVQDNGPGLNQEDLAKVFGEYLASSKFGKGQCSRGQQGIGISAATTWAQLTNAKGVVVTTKTKKMRKAVHATINVDIKGNKGILKTKKTIDWKVPHGLKVEFRIDGRVQLNGDGGIITYLEATALLNPHLTLHYNLLDKEPVTTSRVSTDVPVVPPATNPHPHTLKLGEFITHAHLFPTYTLSKLLCQAFSRVTDATLKSFTRQGLPKSILNAKIQRLTQAQFKTVYTAIQNTELQAPSTRSVLTIGEESLAKSIHRMGEVDFFAVVTRKPRICDFKPVVVEVAIARFVVRGEQEDPVRVLRFANRVPLQFDKGNCAITKAIESVNWRSYGLTQPRSAVPRGPYVFAVSVVSPFIKFKNASKETIDASEELVDEIRLSLMRAGQKLSRHIKRELKAADLERKIQHIEKFGPILVEGLARVVGAGVKRKTTAEAGLAKILGRDTKQLGKDLDEAEKRLSDMKQRNTHVHDAVDTTTEPATEEHIDSDDTQAENTGRTTQKPPKKSAAKSTPRKSANTRKKASAKSKTAQSKSTPRKTVKKTPVKQKTTKAKPKRTKTKAKAKAKAKISKKKSTQRKVTPKRKSAVKTKTKTKVAPKTKSKSTATKRKTLAKKQNSKKSPAKRKTAPKRKTTKTR